MAARHTLKDGEVLENVFVDDVPASASNDAFVLLGSNNKLINPKCEDFTGSTEAHRDFVQGIPTGLEFNAQFCGAIAYNNFIEGGRLEADSHIQPFFFGDGGQVGLTIQDSVIDTKSQHNVSVFGALHDVSLYNIKDQDGKDADIFLDNMRFGGGHKLSFYVTSFLDDSYETINTDQNIDDRRGEKWRKNAIYIDNFDRLLFREISENLRFEYSDVEPEKRFDVHFTKVVREYERRSGQNLGNNKMRTLRLDRFASDDDVTISRLYLDDEFICHSLEDEFREEKVAGETRIPAGIYKIGIRDEGGFHNRYSKMFPFHKGMLELKDVPNFKYILLHVGNYERDTTGCLLVGKADLSAMAVWQSKKTYTRVYNLLIDDAINGNLQIVIEDNDR